MMELMVALFLALFVAIAAGVIYTASQRSYRQGEGKLALQRSVTQAVEQVGRDVRAARQVQLVSATEIRAFDETGTETARWTRGLSGGIQCLLHGGMPAVPEECTFLSFSANADTTLLLITVELMDGAQNRIRVQGRSSLRNRNYSGI